MRTLKNRALCALGIAVIEFGLLSTAATQSLTWLGTLGGEVSIPYGVTDLAVVVGQADDEFNRYLPFRWENGTMTSIGTLGGLTGVAFAISWDGSVIVGGAQTSEPFRYRPFLWDGTMQDLGTLGGSRGCYATSISGYGRVVVGFAPDANESRRAFRWENGTMTQLTTDGIESFASDVSEDGSVVVGTVIDANQNGIAFRWENGEVIYFLGNGCCSGAATVSAGGDKIAGEYSVNNQTHAYYWDGTTLQDLGRDFRPLAMSADGKIVVGNHPVWYIPYRWTSETGLQDLNVVYASLLSDGSSLASAIAISPNGRYIVGVGYNAASGRGEEAYLLDTGPPCTTHEGDVDESGVVDDADLLQVLFVFGSTGDDLGRADVNCDNQIDDADLLIVLFNFGSCPGC